MTVFKRMFVNILRRTRKEVIIMEKPQLNKPARQIFPQAQENINFGKCPLCSKEIKEQDFKDSLSKKEYGISGMCQECQDKTFG